MSEPTAVFLGFAHALRSAGMPVPPDRAQAFLDACARLGVARRSHVYWAGRATLCADPSEIAVFDRTFEHWFTSDATKTPRAATGSSASTVQALLDSQGAAVGESGRELSLSVLASADEVLRHRDIAELTDQERRRLARLFASLDVRIPQRRRVRRRPAGRGEIDPAATVRDQLRHAGEPGRLHHRRARLRPRRIVLLIDVSGSMGPYADSLLRLAHRIVSAAGAAEVFTLGTALTRVTSALHRRDVEQALAEAGSAIPDWSGGTRLGEGLRAFLDRWGQRGLARGAVVVIASDGWEAGDVTLLAEQMRRLRLLAHRIVWANPHAGRTGYAPVQSGIAAVLPYLDAFVAGHSMAAFADLLEVLADA